MAIGQTNLIEDDRWSALSSGRLPSGADHDSHMGGEATVFCTPFLELESIRIYVTADGVSKDYEGYQLLFLTLLQP